MASNSSPIRLGLGEHGHGDHLFEELERGNMRAVAAEIVIASEDEEVDLRVGLHDLAIGLGREEDGFEGHLRPIEQISEENVDPGPLWVEGLKEGLSLQALAFAPPGERHAVHESLAEVGVSDNLDAVVGHEASHRTIS
jgi:hypothetical protein